MRWQNKNNRVKDKKTREQLRAVKLVNTDDLKAKSSRPLL